MSPDNKTQVRNWWATLLNMWPLILAVIILLFLRESFSLPVSEFDSWFASIRDSQWAIPIVMASFVAGSFFCVPQWALFAGVIAVFGPVNGAILSWSSSLVSGSINFIIGRLFGQRQLNKAIKSGGRAAQFVQGLQRNGFLASFAVRFIPTGPYIFVNALAGAAGMRYLAFICGTGLGIVPKILVVAFLAQGFLGEEDRLGATLFFIGAACLIMAFGWLLKHKFTAQQNKAHVDEN